MKRGGRVLLLLDPPHPGITIDTHQKNLLKRGSDDECDRDEWGGGGHECDGDDDEWDDGGHEYDVVTMMSGDHGCGDDECGDWR